MAPKSTKSTVDVASKRPYQRSSLEKKKLKVIKDYKGGESVRVTAHQAGMSHSPQLLQP